MTKPKIVTPPPKPVSQRVKVVMLKTAKGADDQIRVKTYVQGQEYEISDHLAANFVKDGNAQYSGVFNKQKQPHDNKALTPNYQNKSA